MRIAAKNIRDITDRLLPAAITELHHLVVIIFLDRFPLEQFRHIIFPAVRVFVVFDRQIAGIAHMALAGIVRRQHKLDPLQRIGDILPVCLQPGQILDAGADILFRIIQQLHPEAFRGVGHQLHQPPGAHPGSRIGIEF